MRAVSEREKTAQTEAQRSELISAEARQRELDRLLPKLYEDWASERITERSFLMLSDKYQSELAALEKKLESLRAERRNEGVIVDHEQEWNSLIQRYLNPSEMTAEMLRALIEKIVVHEAVKSPDGTRDQEIEIYYRFPGRQDD